MANISLITGGCRSGKSSYALELAEKHSSTKKVFIATCPPTDNEINLRIDKHKEERAGRGWETIEEQTDLIKVLSSIEPQSVVLVDCITLWVSNLMFKYHEKNITFDEDFISKTVLNLVNETNKKDINLYCVTNEVGMGVVPENEVGRKFRDLAGKCNQVLALHSKRVVLVSCGIPINLK